MLNIVLFGPPGAGKGTQSEKVLKKYNLVHLSTGDLFRLHLNNETALGLEAKKYMNGMPHSTPELDEILNLWKSSTDIVKDSLINLDEQELKNKFTAEFKHGSEAEKINLGTDISRLIFHLWNHLGEIASVRQLLGKKPGNPGYGKWDWRY